MDEICRAICAANPFKEQKGNFRRIAFLLFREPLLPKVQGFYYCPVSFYINCLQVLQQTAALTYQAEQRALRAVVVLVRLEVFRKVADTVGE